MAEESIPSRPEPAAHRPWRPWSLLVPAIVGGPLAVTGLGLLNAARLGLPRRSLLAGLASPPLRGFTP